jgi:hypothetical protein
MQQGRNIAIVKKCQDNSLLGFFKFSLSICLCYIFVFVSILCTKLVPEIKNKMGGGDIQGVFSKLFTLL